MDDGLAHVGVGVAGQAAEPGLDRIQALADGGDAAAVDDALQAEQLLLGAGGVLIGDDDGGGQVAEGDIIGAERFQGRVGVGRLALGVGIDQRRLAVEHHLAQHGSRPTCAWRTSAGAAW